MLLPSCTRVTTVPRTLSATTTSNNHKVCMAGNMCLSLGGIQAAFAAILNPQPFLRSPRLAWRTYVPRVSGTKECSAFHMHLFILSPQPRGQLSGVKHLRGCSKRKSSTFFVSD